MNLKVIVPAVLIGASVAAIAAPKTSTDLTTVAVVNVNKIIQQSAEHAKLEKADKDFTQRWAKLLEARSKLMKEMSDANKKASDGGAAQKGAWEKKLKAQEKSEADFQKDYMTQKESLMKSVYDDIKTAVEVIAKKNNFKLVMNNNQVWYSENQKDITSQVIKYIDKENKS